MIRLFPTPLIPILLLAGCASSPREGFPSLAPRAIEQRGEAIETPPPAPPVPADAALSAELAKLQADGERGDKDFAAALPATERAVSAAARSAPSSEAWVAAQSQLSALDAARAPTATALSALDSMYLDFANRVTSDPKIGGIAEIEAARGAVEALYNRQIERLAGLRGRLSQP